MSPRGGPWTPSRKKNHAEGMRRYWGRRRAGRPSHGNAHPIEGHIRLRRGITWQDIRDGIKPEHLEAE